jgi:hypothetical protein
MAAVSMVGDKVKVKGWGVEVAQLASYIRFVSSGPGVKLRCPCVASMNVKQLKLQVLKLLAADRCFYTTPDLVS